MNRCPACGELVSPDREVCDACGAPVPDPGRAFEQRARAMIIAAFAIGGLALLVSSLRDWAASRG
jgi:uncharacterized OB-fold protein